MIPVSDAVHEALRLGSKQRVLLHYTKQDTYLTMEDVVLSSWSYTGSFNPDDDLTMGRALSASLKYSLINADGFLNSFGFGEFDAYMGVLVGKAPYTIPVGSVAAVNFDGIYLYAYDTAPYIRYRDGAAYEYQPDSPVKAFIVRGKTLLCVLTSTRSFVVTLTDPKTWGYQAQFTWVSQESVTWGSYKGTMTTGYLDTSSNYHLIQRYIDTGTSVDFTGNRSTIFSKGRLEIYEYAKIGHFYADRPSRVQTNVVQVQSYDAMEAVLGVMADARFTATSLLGLLDEICSVLGVEHKVTDLLNADLPVDTGILQTFTYREVVAKIAEASCSYARFDYDGKLDLVWFNETNLVLDERRYEDFEPYEYVVKPITKLQVRSTTNDVGILVGSGSNGYVIQGNPFLAFNSDADGQKWCGPIYSRLSSFSAYTPGSIRWFADWTYQPGDVVSVAYQGKTFRFPLFMQDISGAALAVGTAECTGSEYRKVIDAQAREEYRAGYRFTEIYKTIDGVSVKCGLENLATGQTLYSEISAVADSLSLKVARDDIISAINMSPEEIQISAARITLNGTASFNNNVVIGEDGKITAKEGTFTRATMTKATITDANITNSSVEGTLTAGAWRFDSAGAAYSYNGMGMYIKQQNNRAYMYFTGMDGLYGTDTTHDVYVSGRSVILAAEGESSSGEAVAAGWFISPASGSYYNDVCIIDTMASAGAPKGNVGAADRRWDMVYCRSVSQSSSRYVKENIEDLPEVGDILDVLRPVSFDYKSNKKHSFGLILEDTMGIVPEACDIPDDGDTKNGGISYDVFIPLLLKEVQSLRKRVSKIEGA